MFLGLLELSSSSSLFPQTEPRACSARFTPAAAREIGRALFTHYLLPFEVTSMLILIAILGAVVLARKEI